jgi:pimeloyl-ACP methyl ester carboxylesterase
LFRHLAAPIARSGRSLVLPELFHPVPLRCDPRGLAERLAPVVPPDATILVHGLALPVGLALVGLGRGASLVLLDGPLEGLDPVTSAVATLARRAPGVVRGLLHPTLLVRLLSSSLALRRTVVNPYVMDRDIVALLFGPVVATSAHRRAVTEYLGQIMDMTAPWANPGVPVALLWSSSNRPYPIPRHASRSLGGASVRVIVQPGTRYFNVEERPWEVAEALLAWLARAS